MPTPANTLVHANVRRASPNDVNFVLHVARQWTYELGFLSKQALMDRVEGRNPGGVYIGNYNDTEAGFLQHGAMRAECSIFQAGVSYDLTRRTVGAELVQMFIDDCIQSGTVKLISLRCLVDTDANAFWEAMGFKRLPRPERGKKGLLSVWHRRLPAFLDEGLFIAKRREHPCPGCGKKTYDTWTEGGRRWRTCPVCTEARFASHG